MTRHRIRNFARDERGSALVEFAVVLPVFLLVLFVLIEFGRLGFEYVMANKAVQLAGRMAVTRPAACPGVPTINLRGAVAVGSVPPAFGTTCRSGSTVCAAPATVTCVGNASNATAAEIWAMVSPVMPVDATIANLRFSYAYTPAIGFLGGPYVPMVTTEVTGLNFRFVLPLNSLAAVVTGVADPERGPLPFPPLTFTLPGEDLALGEAG
jgi:Flp pilus assembly protein TadG